MTTIKTEYYRRSGDLHYTGTVTAGVEYWTKHRHYANLCDQVDACRRRAVERLDQADNEPDIRKRNEMRTVALRLLDFATLTRERVNRMTIGEAMG